MRKELKEFFQSGSIYSIGIFAEQSIHILYLPIVTAALTTAEYGIVALGVISAQLAAKLMAPYNTALTRYYYYPKLAGKQDTLVWSLLILMAGKALLVSSMFWWSAPLLAKVLGGADPEFVRSFRLFAFVVFLQPVLTFFLVLLRLQQRPLLFVTVSIIRAATSLGIIACLLLVYGGGITAIPLATAAGLAVACCIMFPFFACTVKYGFNLGVCREPLSYGYPLIVSNYSNNALKSGDRFILRMFCPLALVGVYDVAYRVGAIINFLLGMPAKHALQPIAFKKEGVPEAQKNFVRRTATVYYSVALFAGLGLSLFAKEILMIFARNPSYWTGWSLVPLVVFGYLQHGLGHFIGLGLVMKKKAVLQSGILLAVALVNIALNIVLIPRLGLLGAALATVAAYILWSVMKGYFSWKYYNLGFEYGRLIVLSVLWWVIVLPGHLLSESTGIFPVVGKLVLLGAFPAALLVGGFLRQDEKEYLHEIIHKMSAVFKKIVH